ncbi:hypothetical protein SH1V18_37030 [Vallitalea longa]|uniref:Transglutaminase-like domain-containing protein n=1 Tax=Vallitalea longa TaxID=2936439 RepID=A0A9W5YF88_9FIRM|nr:transglutaminase-like domain-containing protein [Vallitalea longa]GKX31223.1 hypothetical protein SH1V18_37030 [Vallitalea longa]
MRKYIKNILDISLFELTKILIAYSIIITISGLLWYEIGYVELFAIIVCTYVILSIITYNGKFFLISICSITFMLIITYSILAVSKNLIKVICKINDYMDIYSNAIINGSLLEIKDQIIPIIFIAFIVSLIIIFLSKCKHFFACLLVFGLTIFLTASFVRGYYNVTGFYIFIIAIITNYFYYFYNKNIKDKDKKGFYLLAVNSIIFSVIIIFLAGNLYRAKPRPLIFIYDVSKALEDYFENMQKKRTEKKYEGNSGKDNYDDEIEDHEEVIFNYDSTDELKSKVETTLEPLLYVYTDKTLYLRGSTCNMFDGKQWDYYVNYENDINDEDEHIYALSSSAKNYNIEDVKKSLFNDKSVGITYKNISTPILFTPNNFISIYDSNGNNSNDSFEYSDRGIVYGAALTDGFTYSINYLEPKYDMELLQELLYECKEGLYYGSMTSSYKKRLIDKARNIRRDYMFIPDTITDRTVELAEKITKSSNSEYEKAKAIEKYLKDNIEYSYTTNLPDNNEDILDYFLFETKEGFCTYSATAMVIMARSVGIPARYVKGFVVGEREELEPDMLNQNHITNEKKDSKTVVTGWDAHAWVEVYLEGYGWLPFEPTSGFSLVDTTVEEDYIELPDEDIKIEEEIYLENVNTDKKRIPVSAIIIFLIVIKIVLSVSVIGVRLRKRKQYYNLGTTSKKIITLFSKTLMLMEVAGYKKSSNQTIREYAKTINGELDNSEYNLFQVVKIYEKACYAKGKLEDSQLKIFEGYYQFIKTMAKERTNMITVNIRLFIYNIK